MPKRVVLLGHPVSHSLSEALQRAAFAAADVDALYEPVDTPTVELPGGRRGPAWQRVPGRQHRRTTQGAGRAHARPAHRRGPAHGRRGHGHEGWHPARRAQHGGPRVPTGPRCPGGQPEDAQGGRRPGGRRRRPGRGPRAHRGRLPQRRRLQPASAPCRAPREALLAQRRAHGPAGQALARVGHRGRAGQDGHPHQCQLGGPGPRGIAAPRRAAAAGDRSCSTCTACPRRRSS